MQSNMNNLTTDNEEIKAYFAGNWTGFYSQFLELHNGNGDEYKAICPFHDDSDPSLSVNNKTGQYHCFGCDASGDAFSFYGELKGISSFDGQVRGIAADFNIMGSNGKKKSGPGRIVKTYDYMNEEGAILYQAVRMEPKDFRQRQPDGNGGWTWSVKNVDKVLYRLPELLQADQVIVVEGEKDVDNIFTLGMVATTNVGGAGKWQSSYSETLRGKDVVILPDNDEPGRKHADKVAEALRGIAKSIKIIELPGLPEKGDVSDWIDAGGTKEVLHELIGQADEWMPGQEQSGQEWGSPILLDDYQVPAFDVELPGILGEMSAATSAATETPIELAVAMALGTVATAIHGKMVVQVKPGHIEPTNFFLVAALDPSNRKSAVNSTMTKPLTMWEAGQRDLLSARIKQVESENMSKDARIKALRGKYGKAKPDQVEAIQEDIFNLEMGMEEVPKVYRTWAQDITPERLGTMLSNNGDRMAIISTEGGIFEIIGGRYSNGIPNLDVFLQGYSGDALRVDRGSREPLFVENPALSIVLSPQPEVLRAIGEKKTFRGRGLLARFWYFIPVSNLGYRTLETAPIPEGVRDGWKDLIYTLLDIKPQTDERNQIEPYIIKLDRAAYAEWFDFAMMVEVEMREGGRFEHITDWAGKLPGGAARVAGVLHCVKNPQQPWGTPIDVGTMKQSLDLAAVASSHAEVAFNLMGADVAIEGAKKVWRWVEGGRFESFTKRDSFQALRGTFPRVSDLEIPLDVLEERNYIAGATAKGGPQGGRPSITYTVNPEIIKGWA